MTLKKIEQASAGNPILRQYEVQVSPKITIISEPRSMETKFSAEQGSDALVADIELENPIKPDQYELMCPDPQERKNRIGSTKRLWFINATNQNYLIDTFGDQEKDWVNKSVTLETIQQDVFGTLRSVIYVKGAKVLV